MALLEAKLAVTTKEVRPAVVQESSGDSDSSRKILSVDSGEIESPHRELLQSSTATYVCIKVAFIYIFL